MLLKRVSVIMAYKRDNNIRDEIFKWIMKYYAAYLPDVELCIGECNRQVFNKSYALNQAAQKATRDVLAIADGDVFYNPQLLSQSIKLLNNHAWIIPYNRWLNLSASTTKRILLKEPQWPIVDEINYIERYKESGFQSVSGIIVLRRSDFYRVNGFDERFVGYGFEDTAFSVAMNTICGSYKRLKSDLYHLSHPKIKLREAPNYESNKNLYKKYVMNSGSIAEMEKLVKDNSNHQ